MQQKNIFTVFLSLMVGALLIPMFGYAQKALGPGANWMADFKEAQKKSLDEKKPVFLYFTGSSWCPPCMLADKEIFLSGPFMEFANRELILVKADFTRRGEAISKEHGEMHQQLFDAFAAEGFPTVVLIAPDGKVIEKFFGYRPGGGEAYVEYLRSLIKEAGLDES